MHLCRGQKSIPLRAALASNANVTRPWHLSPLKFNVRRPARRSGRVPARRAHASRGGELELGLARARRVTGIGSAATRQLRERRDAGSLGLGRT
ncbi:hypothetical protein EVAR_72697_1 [Eumeta japonica]|uniref:Uncharacterized protein n=1 Tax=Eumeta variegata TaxID=151549 RepID=A0A4C1TTC2_EUMVA|nr:hypothetical protein EVAR_72697_1 [Eumeta japonica]